MLNEQTLDKLYALKLNGMADAFREQLQQPSCDGLSFAERLGLLVDRQWNWKEDARMKRYSKPQSSSLPPVSRTSITGLPAGSIAPC